MVGLDAESTEVVFLKRVPPKEILSLTGSTREQLRGKSKAVEQLSVCWFRHCALLCSHANSFPTLIPSTVLMAASDNPICRNNEVNSPLRCAQFFRYLSCSTFILCAALLFVKGTALSLPSKVRSCCIGVQQTSPAAWSPPPPRAPTPERSNSYI